MALEDKTVPGDLELNPDIVEAIHTRQVDDKLPCAQAFLIAETLEVEPSVVGQTADGLDVRLSRCQLGLFGYPGKQGWDHANIAEHPVPDGLPGAVRTAGDASGHLSCIEAWQLAEQFDVPRMLVGYVADQLDIKILQCQLGAF
jgi:hypothetical protein